MPKCGNFVMILVSIENAYKMFILKIFVEECYCVKNVLCEQAINNILPLLKGLSCYFPPP